MIFEGMNEVLEECINRDMVTPFTVVIVGANGNLLATKIEFGKEREIIAQHLVDKTSFGPVLNIMIVDANGKGARIVWEGRGQMTFH